MCTIIALHGVHPAYPLVVAANRDEFLDRPASGPRRLQRDPPALGGVDLDKGGTWMAAASTGFFVGLTNQRPTRPQAPAQRSRGELVLEALASGSVEGTQRLLEAVDSTAYNDFNLMFGDGRQLCLAYVRSGQPTEFLSLEPGLHVLANDRMGRPLAAQAGATRADVGVADAAQRRRRPLAAHAGATRADVGVADAAQRRRPPPSTMPKTYRAHALVTPLVSLPWPDLCAGLARVLADHQLPDPDALAPMPPGLLLPPEVARQLQALCIHLPRYGTRSATILALEPGRLVHWLYADGKPCEVGFEDGMGLLSP